jgi:uncharacterized membrane protein
VVKEEWCPKKFTRINFYTMASFVETKTRSVAKTIIWRVVATLITWGTIYAYTGKLSESIEITIVAALIGMTAYYIHERIWNGVGWGKVLK